MHETISVTRFDATGAEASIAPRSKNSAATSRMYLLIRVRAA